MQFSHSGYLGPYIQIGLTHYVAPTSITDTEDKTKLVDVGGGVMSAPNGPFAHVIHMNKLLGHDPENAPGGARWTAALWRPFNTRSVFLEAQFQKAIQEMDALVAAEVQARRVVTPENEAPGIARLASELAAHQALIAEKTTLLAQHQIAANAFYGSTPIGKDLNAFVERILSRSTGGTSFGDIFQEWNVSLNAAYETRALEAALARLSVRADSLRAEIDSALAQEQARLEAERLAAEATAKAEAERLANTYPVLGSMAAAGPTVLTAAGTLVSAATQLAVRASLGAAIGGLAALASGVATGLFVGVSALFYSSKLGNGELPQRYALQTPLSDLAYSPPSDLHAIAANGGSIELPYRISSRADAEGHSEILVLPTDGQAIPSGVRVLAATYDAQRNLYSATTADTPPRTLTWTPIVNPGDPSTALPTEQTEPPVYDGAAITPMDGRIDVFPGAADASFDDYIIVFPADSGMPPIYTMFRDRREEPGTGSGSGPEVDGSWAKTVASGDGAPIPKQIADKLRDRNFNNWRQYREALWRGVANDEALSTQFSAFNIARMKRGRAPFVPKAERVGRRSVVELHHKHLISKGGDVYNAENISLATPKLHISIHKGSQQ